MNRKDIMISLLRREEIQIDECENHPYGTKRLSVAICRGIITLVIRTDDGSILEEFALDEKGAQNLIQTTEVALDQVDAAE